MKNLCEKELYINSKEKKTLVSAKKQLHLKAWFSVACFAVNDNTMCPLFLNTT